VRSGNTFRFLILCALLLPPPALQAQDGPEGPAEEAPEPVVTRFPELQEFVEAAYPPEAFAAGLEAAVGLQVDIDETGKVIQVLVDVPAGNGFDEAAVAAAERFVFTPAELDGAPAPVRISYTYNFKIQQKIAPGEEGQTLAGQVREKGVRLPIPGAEVALEGTPFRQTTNRKGKFRFKNVEAGRYRIVVTSPSTKTLTEEIQVQEGKKLDLKLYAEPKVVNEYRTVVVGKKVEAVVTKYTLETRTLETVPGTSGDPIKAISSLPGIQKTPFSAGLLVIRGANPGDSAILLDGVGIPLLYHFLSGPSVINPNFLEDISFYPGNFPVRYGGATAGIIDVGAKNRRVDQFGGEIDINLLNVAAYVETPIGKKVSARAAVRRSYIDAILPAVLDAAGQDSTTILPVYWDYQAKVDWFPALDQRVSLFVFGSDDQLRLATTSKSQDLDVNVGIQSSFHRVAAEWALSREKVRIRVSPSAGYDYFTFGADETFIDGNSWNVGNRTEVAWIPLKNLRLTFGNEARWVHPRFNGRIPVPKNYYLPGSTVSAGFGSLFADDTERFLRADHYGFLGFYVEASWRPWESLEILPGFRSDVILYPGAEAGGVDSMVTWDPRLSVRYTPHPKVTVKAGVGKFSRPPDFQFLDRDFGNPNLLPEWADQYSLGVEWDIWGPLQVDTQAFFLRRHDRAVASDAFTLGDSGVDQVFFESTGEGRSYGWEFLFKVKPEGRFYGWVAYTLSVSEERERPSEPWRVTFFDQTHILSIVGSVKLGRGWETGLRFRFISGKPVTPISGAAFVADQSSYIPYTGRELSNRLEPFIQLDLRVEKQWTFEKWLLSAYLDIQNVTNHANSEFQQWDYRFRKNSTIPSVPIFPTIGINARW